MVVRILFALAVVAVVGGVALVLERRRRGARGAPVLDPYPIPRQLTRADFPRPEAPWLVVLFSSSTCDGCEVMGDRVAALASDEVATVEISWQQDRPVHERYGVSGVPMTLVADAEGVVRRAFVGAASATHLWAAVAAARDPALEVPHGLDGLA